MKTTLKIVLLVLLSFAVGAYFYPQLPDKMVSHWDTLGRPNGYMPKMWGVFLTPIISVFMLLLFIFLPKLDPLKENVKKFKKYFDLFIIVILLFMLYLNLLVIFWNLGAQFSMNRFLPPAFAILFFFAGVLIENSKRNWFIGIKTPWTLSSDSVWDKTHKVGAKLFKASALISLLGVIFPDYAMWLLLVPVIFSSVYVSVYSYIEFKKETQK